MMNSELPMRMPALVLQELGEGFSGCRLRDIAVPVPGEGEVLIKVHACAVNFVDLLMTRGAYQQQPSLPFVPGSDISGTVVALGSGVAGFAIGDEVVASHLGGGFAGYVSIPAAQVTLKPKNLSFTAAAAYGSAYLTAYVALVRRARLEPGEWLLVHGASGGVGLAAVDLGRVLGGRVIAASASKKKLALIAQEYVPEAVVDISAGFKDKVKEITGGAGANVILDPVGGDVFDESTRCIAFDGRLLVVGFTSGRIPAIATNIMLIKGFSVMGVRAGEYGRRFPEKGKENVEAVWRLASEGCIHPRVHAVLPLQDWRSAFDMVNARDVVGRVILQP